MAKWNRKRAGDAPVLAPPAMLAQQGAFDGDSVVFVRLVRASQLLPCLAKSEKQRQMFVNGLLCEHTGEAADGTWIYDQRAT